MTHDRSHGRTIASRHGTRSPHLHGASGQWRRRAELAHDRPALDLGLYEEEFAGLVRPHLPGLLRLARRIMRREDLAWDAVQESLVSLWQAEIKPAEPRPWLARTVLHRCLHMRRSLQRRSKHEEQAAECFLEAGASEDPTRLAEVRQLAAALQHAVAGLPPDQRIVFQLRELGGTDYEQIAEALKVPVGTVRSRLHRARLALQRALTALEPTAKPAPCRGSYSSRLHRRHTRRPA